MSSKRKPSKHITLQQIADHCGVTKGTVSLALRGHHSIGDATTARIIQAAKEMGYNPAIHDAARRLAAMRNHDQVLNRVIALYFDYLSDTSHIGFFEEAFLGVMEGLRERGFAMLVEYGIKNAPGSLKPLLEQGRIDGVLMLGLGEASHSAINRLRHTPGFADRPLVSFLSRTGDSWVTADEEQSAYTAARHLIELGHRHLMQCTYPRLEGMLRDAPAERIAGVRRALLEAGLDPAHYLHLQVIDSLWCHPNSFPAGFHNQIPLLPEDETQESLRATLRAKPEITGILALNDACAIRIWHTLHHSGFRVPDDISIIGFDDTDPMLNESGQNILTTLHMPLYEIGKNSAYVITEQVLNQHADSAQVLLPTKLVVRHSTAPAKCK